MACFQSLRKWFDRDRETPPMRDVREIVVQAPSMDEWRKLRVGRINLKDLRRFIVERSWELR